MTVITENSPIILLYSQTSANALQQIFRVFRFQKLERAGNGYQILECSHVEKALCTWSQFSDESVSENSVMQLQHELPRYGQRKDELKSLHDKLIVHYAALADEMAQLVSISTACKTELQHIADQVCVDNSIVSVLQSLLSQFCVMF